MRIIILYSFNWHNKYFDQVVLVLTTLDPLINHCVCLWTMRKYRDGYASSLGKVFSCFKPSEEGVFRSAITRLSSISRRSFSRSSSSARSSSMRNSRRKSCKLDILLLLSRKAPGVLDPAVVLPPLRVQNILPSLKIRAPACEAKEGTTICLAERKPEDWGK